MGIVLDVSVEYHRTCGAISWSLASASMALPGVSVRTSEVGRPMAMVVHWRPPSTRSTHLPFQASPTPRFAVVVVLLTPPFWLAMAMVFAVVQLIALLYDENKKATFKKQRWLMNTRQ